jgi:predicted outer membrane repeat protein
MRSTTVFFKAIHVMLLLAGSLFAVSKNHQEVEMVVTGWLRANPRPLGVALKERFSRIETIRGERDGVIGYIVHLQPSGFVVVAADDQVEPIIAFTGHGSYDNSPDSPLSALITNDLKGRIAATRTGSRLYTVDAVRAQTGIQQKWSLLRGLGQPSKGPLRLKALHSVSDVRVAPLLRTKWGQLWIASDDGASRRGCYNYYTPQILSDGTLSWDRGILYHGDADNYFAGCVATAMAQLMRYYEFPKDKPTQPDPDDPNNVVQVGRFNADGTFVPLVPDVYRGLLGGDGLGGKYAWAQMPVEPNGDTTTEQAKAIGALCHDAGVAARMEYAAQESRTKLYHGKQALINNFHYESAVYYNADDGNIGPVLVGMINPNLDAGRPVIVGILGPNLGHAVVVDGYGYDSGTLYHHLNMGWEGADNVWYNLPIIECQEQGYSFNVLADCIYNVFDTGHGEIISGRVLGEDGQPAHGAVVYRSAAGPDPCEVLTDRNGIYFFDNLEPDTTYTIWASAHDLAYPSRQIATGISFDHAFFTGNRWAVDFPQTHQLLYVDQRALAGADDGSSWPNAFIDLQDALQAAANSPDRETEIWVARGTYRPDRTTGRRELSFRLVNRVALYGGFAGSETERDQRDPAANETILTGDLRGDDGGKFTRNEENSHHVVDARGTDGTAVLDGFTISGGNADGDNNTITGAGIVLFYSKSVISNCRIIGNHAALRGGGVYSQDSTPTLDNCVFSDNSAPFGAGMMNHHSSAVLSNCKFIGNVASETGGGLNNNQDSSPTVSFCMFTGNSAADGAGMSCQSNSNTRVSNCEFAANNAVESGGGIYCRDSSLTVETCEFHENSAGYGGGLVSWDYAVVSVSNCQLNANRASENGGGLSSQSSKLAVDSSRFYNNTAKYGGGVSNLVEAEVSLSNCEFKANRATENGGGIITENSKLTAAVCTFHENSAQFGGAIIGLTNAEVLVSNCEFRDNRAAINGGGIYSQSSKSTVQNSIFNENSANSGGGMSSLSESETALSDCVFSGNDAIANGGGLYNQQSNLTVINCTLLANSAEQGGGLLTFQGSVSLSNCRFTRNTAVLYGGGMFSEAGNSETVNCMFTENAADAGGGVLNFSGGAPVFTNCNFVGNRARQAAGGGGILNYENTNAMLSNCIVRSNTNGQLGKGNGGSSKVTFSNVEGGLAGQGNIDADPLFADPLNGDYHLKSRAGRWNPNTQAWVIDSVTSPCVDKGDPSTHIGNEPSPNGGIINMGAHGGTSEASRSPGN